MHLVILASPWATQNVHCAVHCSENHLPRGNAQEIANPWFMKPNINVPCLPRQHVLRFK
jgi:hypothetical protein